MATTEPACEPVSAEATAMDTENPSSASRPSIKCSLPSILVGSLSYIVVIATCLLGVWFGSVQPFVRRTGGKLKDDNSECYTLGVLCMAQLVSIDNCFGAELSPTNEAKCLTCYYKSVNIIRSFHLIS